VNHFDDTIAAISTPVGQGGIGIVRISGPGSVRIADALFQPRKKSQPSYANTNRLQYGHIIDPASGKAVDEVLVAFMRSPYSYTREDVVEINCHGGMISVRKILEIILDQGARLAEPGEFTKRAFLNGRISLTQAEAVLDLITAKTEESMKIAAEQLEGGLADKLEDIRNDLFELCSLVEAHIDFPEDEIDPLAGRGIAERLVETKRAIDQLSKTFREARFFREGLSVAIIGRPNVGKSSLLNAFLQKDRAIVTEIPGTTRDQIEEYINIKGLPIRITDTAGIRHSNETVEREGIRRSLRVLETSDFIIALIDGSEPLTDEDHEMLSKIRGKNAVIAINKTDLQEVISLEHMPAAGKPYLRISALTGKGIEDLKSVILNENLKDWKEERIGVVVTNIRHKQALDKASSHLEQALTCMTDRQPLEILAIELKDALDSIGEITGIVTSEDILNTIFNDLCIGK
jgi:tRNA modification GTPase